MKRMITVLLLAAMCSANTLAQKGMSGFGVNIPLSIGQGTTAFGIGAKYYINISDYVRLEPSGEFLAIHSGGNSDEYDYPMFKGFLNGHLFLMSPRPSRPYIIAGLGYVHYNQNIREENGIAFQDPRTGTITGGSTFIEYYDRPDDCFNYNIGLGYDFRLTHSFSMQLEATGLSCITDRFGRHSGNWTFLARVGLTYNL